MMRRRSLMGGGPKDYIEFANEKIGAYFAQRYGDGIGITYDQAAAITEFDSDLQMRNIVGQESYTFEELNYFTGLVSLPYSFCASYGGTEGYDCHISRLSLPNLTTIDGGCFFWSKIGEIECPKLSYIGYNGISCTTTTRIVLDAYTEHTVNGAMAWLYDLEYIYFANLQSITDAYLLGTCTNANLKVYIATPSGPPTVTVKPEYVFSVASTAKLYVPSNLVSAYKAAGAPWTTAFASINAM